MRPGESRVELARRLLLPRSLSGGPQMERDCDCKIKLCPHSDPPRPINVPPDAPPDDSGFLVIRFKPGALGSRQVELAAAAKESGLHALAGVLAADKLRVQPLIT